MQSARMRRMAAVALVSGLFGGMGCGSAESSDAAPVPTPDAGAPPPSNDDAGSGTGDDGSGATDGPPSASDASSLGPSCSGLVAQPVDKTWTISSGGQSRTFEVHVPTSYDPTKPTPLVLNFHGFTSNGAQQNLLSGMDAKADAAGFIAVHPEGIGSSWNAGACCGQAVQSMIDDVGFVRDMLDALEHDLCIDAKRVFSTGMSNGGFLSHRLGCELSQRIAAIAPVAGVLGIPTCSPSRPVPVMHFHGTADPVVPYNGSAALGFVSAPATFQGWSMRDGCTGDPVQTYSKVDSTCSTYETCQAGVTVTLCTVDGGGHTWPGGLPVPALGYTTTNLSATDAMWEFFKKNPLP